MNEENVCHGLQDITNCLKFTVKVHLCNLRRLGGGTVQWKPYEPQLYHYLALCLEQVTECHFPHRFPLVLRGLQLGQNLLFTDTDIARLIFTTIV